MQQQTTIILSDLDKLKHRLSLTYEERFRGLMQMIRVTNKLKQAKIIKQQ